jgi:CIC family chloride channel protein
MPEEFPAGIKPATQLVAGAVLVGALTGFVGVAFLHALEFGNACRVEIAAVLEKWPPGVGISVFACGTAVCAAFAAWLVKRFAPNAAGSGVPYVEKILRSPELPNHRFVLPVKFFGGLIALSSGLVLGREGPLVQMGAVIGDRVGRLFRSLDNAWKPLMAAGAGAGLATAFNAPVGGTIFILEEVLRKVTPVSFVLAAAAAVTSALVQRGIFGMGLDFTVESASAGPVVNLSLYLAFGLAVGLLGTLYNKLLLSMVAAGGFLQKMPFLLRAMLIGGIVGTVGWFLPRDTTGGDQLTQLVLAGNGTPAMLITIALARFFLGPLSYAAGTPGGLFAPVVTLGALIGAATGYGLNAIAPQLVPSPVAFAVAGMAAFFTASIRAPLTGIVICLEMTGCYELFLPMLATCLGAYIVPTFLRCDPIYDALARLRST